MKKKMEKESRIRRIGNVQDGNPAVLLSRGDLVKNMRFEQISEGTERVSQGALWRKSTSSKTIH